MLRLPNGKCRNRKVQGAAATATATAVVVVAAAAAALALQTHKYATLSCKQARQAAGSKAGRQPRRRRRQSCWLACSYTQRERAHLNVCISTYIYIYNNIYYLYMY